MTRALIIGAGGQDGAYLARHLLHNGYDVAGTSRSCDPASLSNLHTLGISEQLAMHRCDLADLAQARDLIVAVKPDEIYHLAGQSSVSLSFDRPAETLSSAIFDTLHLLEAVRHYHPEARFYQASSSECFGDIGDTAADEDAPFRPRSPYGVAKAAAHMLVANYRDAYGLFAASGILFNHESPLRPERFVTRKVTMAAARIAHGSTQRLSLGRLDITRDWGWAPEYVAAMHAILQQSAAADYVVATGQPTTLQDFVAAAFAEVGLNWRDHVDTDPALARPAEIARSIGNPARARSALGWQAQTRGTDVARRMVAADLDALQGNATT